VAALAVTVLMAVSLALRWGRLIPREGREPEPFQVEVLNGAGEPGLAREVTMQLRRLGIDVLLEGNAERYDFPESILIDRRGNPDLLRRLQRRLGVRRTIVQVKPDALVDVTLVVGHDRERLRLQR
jgi:hypothetical protein